MTTQKDPKYSITIHTDDLAVVNCLRALNKYSQRTGNNNIPWGGTKDKDWKRDRHEVTFRFSSPVYRESFVAELRRVLPQSVWNEIGRSDDDPSKPVG
jgi:hypothetical protein